MKVPRRIPVLGEWYEIAEGATIASEDAHAVICEKDRTITLDTGLKDNADYLEKVLYHEIAHAWTHENGLYEVLSEEQLEMVAQSFQGLIRGLGRIEFHKHLLKQGPKKTVANPSRGAAKKARRSK